MDLSIRCNHILDPQVLLIIEVNPKTPRRLGDTRSQYIKSEAGIEIATSTRKWWLRSAESKFLSKTKRFQANLVFLL